MNLKNGFAVLIVIMIFIAGFVLGFKAGNTYKNISEKYDFIVSSIYNLPNTIINIPKFAAGKVMDTLSFEEYRFDNWTKEILKKHINVLYAVNNKNFNEIKDTLIYESIKTGKPDILNFIIKNKIVIFTNDELEKLMLKFCVEQNLPYIDMLINNNVSVNIKNKSGFTPLHFACINNNFDFVKLVTEKGGSYLNDINSYGNTPLSYVNDKSIYDYLVSAGAKLPQNLQKEDLLTKYDNKSVSYILKQSLQKTKKSVDKIISITII